MEKNNSGEYVSAHVTQADAVYNRLQSQGGVESYQQRGDTVYFRTAQPAPLPRRRLPVNLLIAVAAVAIIGVGLVFGGVESTGEPATTTNIISRIDAAIAGVLGNFSTMAGALVGAVVAALLILPAMDKLHTSHRGVWLVVGWGFVGVLVWMMFNAAGIHW